MAYQPLPTSTPRSRMALDLPPLVVPTMPLQLPEMSEKYSATPTIIITPSSPSSDLDFQILHIPSPARKPWSARLRMPWSSSWSNRGPIALETPPLEAPQRTSSKPSWLRVRLRSAMMVAVPLVVIAAHVVIARHYGLGMGMDFGGYDEHHSDWYVASPGAEMHSEA
ncbi:hypothetical protein RhiJN_15556 [Ceratobasidium sp. AG-Ba]|nr:hypothetical protein RhiJN_15556 [Ceratobasidium sp. AG-Ba]